MSMQSEVTGWQSIILIPYKQISGQHGKMLSMNAVVLLLLSLTALLLCRILAERFLRNIELLTDAVEGSGKDNLQLNVVITSGDEILAEVPLVAAESVEKMSFFKAFCLLIQGLLAV